MPRGPFRQLLKVIGMSSASGRYATSFTRLPRLHSRQGSGSPHAFLADDERDQGILSERQVRHLLHKVAPRA